ncbi:MAG: hypothetical protein CMJ70_01065 [Planctomycetaceae bacterium]|nr:hypothetical protein [Planctomycetaceae bacterium]|tara:strand:+ start:6906 stop:8606 length:1701 start_codon:yes stop_codon:yes gene_type:complete
MATDTTKIEADRAAILAARSVGTGKTLSTYTRLSGPGWLQGAITLGGGSLGGSLYLGVIGGYELMWLQPLMMILGIVMLSVIGYVTLSTGERPFQAINRHINPVLGWGWAIATLMANMVWAMPQFALGTAAIQQNLGLFPGDNGPAICSTLLLLTAAAIVWFYDSGGRGIKIFDAILKMMVGVVVLSFFGVVVAMSIEGEGLPWGRILAGFIPDLTLLNRIADGFTPFLEKSSNAAYWSSQILSSQRDKMVTAAATAVGINMTFLLPYSMLKRGWDRDFRGLAVFDLSIGLFIPFMLATSCVVIASATQFHGQYDAGLLNEGPRTPATEKLVGSYEGALQKLLTHNHSEVVLKELKTASARKAAIEQIDKADRQLAAMLVSRDANALALSLEGLTGKTVAQYVFGIGVLGMAISTIIILMLINGFTICEICNQPSQGFLYRFGSLLPGLTGGIGALTLWSSQAKFYVVQPTSIFGMVLLPIAYGTFFLMINSKSLLGEHLPQGGKRIAINAVMLVALIAATIGAGWSIWSKLQWIGVAVVVAFLALAGVVHLVRGNQAAHPMADEP